MRTVRSERILVGRLSCGGDLLDELSGICVRERVVLGRIEAIGSVRRARLAYYSQDAREYRHFTVNAPLEIASLHGNVSLKEGRPFVHAHVVLSDEKGNCRGGHLASGTEVFAGEYVLHVFAGPELSREHDETTGLQLWREGESP